MFYAMIGHFEIIYSKYFSFETFGMNSEFLNLKYKPNQNNCLSVVRVQMNTFANIFRNIPYYSSIKTKIQTCIVATPTFPYSPKTSQNCLKLSFLPCMTFFQDFKTLPFSSHFQKYQLTSARTFRMLIFRLKDAYYTHGYR